MITTTIRMLTTAEATMEVLAILASVEMFHERGWIAPREEEEEEGEGEGEEKDIKEEAVTLRVAVTAAGTGAGLARASRSGGLVAAEVAAEETDVAAVVGD